jgi:hypothetical protein
MSKEIESQPKAFSENRLKTAFFKKDNAIRFIDPAIKDVRRIDKEAFAKALGAERLKL